MQELAQLYRSENVSMTASGHGTGGDKATFLNMKVKPPVLSDKSR